MKQTFTFTRLDRLVDSLDAELSRFPHGNSILLRDGRSRSMTVRDQFAPVFAVFRRENPPRAISLDPDLFLDYWRDCILALNPPAFRPLRPERLHEKGRHAVVLPTLCGPVLRPATSHFEFLEGIGMPGLSDVRVQRVRQGFRRKTVLDKKHRFNPRTENLICFGSPDQLRAFIYGQRGRQPGSPVADLGAYLVEVVGQSSEWVEKYLVLREWSLAQKEAQQP